MTVLKCKLCGGDVEAQAGGSLGTCSHCGSVMTLPRVSDERRGNLYNRANHLRRLCEFDKAVTAYEAILQEDNTEAEAHWGVVLSRYGIEYVEDPGTGQRIPTCHRVQAEPVLRDSDYLMALEHAPDGGAKAHYEEEGKRIAEIQRGILAVSAQEAPYDVFVCYKESTDGGSRTPDSVLAQEIHHHLCEKGLRVFFARVSLEEHLGREYEPYIYAALQSARVMVVVGTRAEHFNAVWVRNEWSRFLQLRRKDRGKVLIPCYKGMSPYDLPEELAELQSQDMERLGFIQDLVRGVEKILGQGRTASAEKAESAGAGEVAGWLKRGWLFLEDGEFDSAAKYAERVLDRDPENGEAYWLKALVDLRLRSELGLANRTETLSGNANYQKALRFGTSELKRRLEAFEADIQGNVADTRRRAAERWVRTECRRLAKEWDEEIVDRVPTGEVDRVEVVEQEDYLEEEVRPGGWFRKEVRIQVQKTRPKLLVKEVPRMREVTRTVRRKGPETLEWSFIDGLGNHITPGEVYEGYGIPVVFLLPGSFMMGSPETETDRQTDEVQHLVTLTRPFALAQTPCTQWQWEAVMGSNPSNFKGKDRPVEQVSWEEAVAFCRKLTLKQQQEGVLAEGWEWRLPTEAEWEYAARAGTTGARHGELDAIAWHLDNSGGETHAVKGKQANAWGLYDMLGNVWEWCADWNGDYPTGSVTDPTGPSSGSNRVVRGGGWGLDARYARSADRRRNGPGFRHNLLGFRPALSSVR